MINELLTKTLAQIVNENHQAASVFEKYNLDFCCKGKRSLQKACEEKELSVDGVVQELNTVLNKERSVLDFNKLSLAALADYIVVTHHDYTKRELPQIFSFLQKISSKHGHRHPEVFSILESFSSLKEEMENHMRKEELILFPRIKEMENSEKKYNECGMNIQAPVAVMEDEHEHAGRLLEKIRLLSNNYTPPADACTTYRLCFAALQTLETDLHQHVHLENNILFPKAINLFKEQCKTTLN
jgi:regulator of cell morphogenesis and NO signaling